jgi:hypothetical protein
MEVIGNYSPFMSFRKSLWYMGTSNPFIFNFLKILKSHTSMFQKIMPLNISKDIYRGSSCKKVMLKILYIFRNTKKINL